MNQSKQLVRLIEIAIMTGIAIILDMVSGMFLKMPQGGSIAVMMIPIFLISFRWGLKAGLTTGFLAGLLQFVSGGLYIAHPLQFLLDYFIAPTAAGIGGAFAVPIRKASSEKKRGKLVSYVTLAVLIGSGLKFLAHLISGAVFFGHYAPQGTPVWIYSLVYNGTYMLPSFIICTIVLCLLLLTAPRLLGRQMEMR
ncbi:energy-coupled thiamine transporter ThiT [Bacillus swezeyi]|uniref:Energy-coupled thiamine transporter ThiT n=1 Tax=Bacillus swezeyi TaxID=1925020 RepID=A0A5M8RQZ1_9BACI|nr:energy-coupled thiamine transporter ThiT [Bacillus swezeyi]KAA6450311.1 energy-coupled thiamine transporter ThiT [Bacillus swezeyi]KAA6475410.1 energy-coupled thiamine transporter ThiT [Bacillus swezeyi]TYS36851.1 energy-coupled thiamine transporter ThiT [Bacillus swezeyi]